MNDINISPKVYVVAVIDMLGQKEDLEKHRFITETPEGVCLPKTSDEQKKFNEIQDRTYGNVYDLRERFKSALKIFRNAFLNHPEIKSFSPEDQKIINNLAKPMSYQFLSDTIIIHTALVEKDELETRYNIAEMIFACATVTLISFSYGNFFRGGIEIGIGAEFPENEGIYGLVLNDAYYLESKIAQYPRIVIGDKLKNLIQYPNKKMAYSKCLADIIDRIDNFCRSIIVEDKDGNFIVDFLSKSIANLSMNISSHQSQDYVGKALVEIGDQYTKWLKKRDIKLCSRYTMLKNYYLEHLDNWDLAK